MGNKIREALPMVGNINEKEGRLKNLRIDDHSIDGYYPEWINQHEFKQVYADLGKHVTDRALFQLGIQKLTKYEPEYWFFAGLLTEEEAAFALSFPVVHHPYRRAEIKEFSGVRDDAKLDELLDHLSYLGVIEYNWENADHEKQWVLPPFVPGSGEFTNMHVDLMEEKPELGMFFNYMTRLPLEQITKMVPPGGAGIGMHVIPVEKAIPNAQEAASVEKISHWLDKYDGLYAASPCSCRRSRMTYEEGCGDQPDDWCIAVGDMAKYVVETKKGGRFITRDEALDILQLAEDNGFVHQITNIDGENKIFAICNCNVNVCYALRTSQLFNTPNMSRSAYVSRIDPKNCVACGRCVEHCPAGAIKLGQKLCRKDGSEVEYPKHDLPGVDRFWGKADWDYDYRDHNRIETYETGTAPCKTACPAHIAIEGYLKMAKEGRYDEALLLIKKNNPLPAICGHICNKRCEDACTRGTIDEALSIDEVKKFLAMRDLDAETRIIPKKVIPSTLGGFDEKVAIIGAGPAGLSCAYYLAEKGYTPTIFEKMEKPGGMMVYGVPSFKLEKEVVAAEIDVIKEMGVEIKCGVEIGKDITIPELREQGYKAFYIAIGCQGGRKTGVPGEEGEDVVTAVDFLREVGANEAYDLKGDTVVIGGGNVAIDVSRSAVRCGSKKVTQVSLETRDIMPASDDEVADAEADGVVFECGWGPKEILRTKTTGKVTGIVFKKCLSVFDDQHRFNPTYDEDDTMTINCKHIILSVGQSILWGDLLKDTAVELGRGQGVVADPQTYQTAEPDIFAGGDVYTGPKFAIDAIAAGKEAAISIHRYVQPHTSLTIGRNQLHYIELDKDDIRVEGYDTAKRQQPGVDASIDQSKSFRDYMQVFTEDQVATETARCLECGASVVDENQCVGCGVCTTKCDFDAIHLFRERPACSTMAKTEDKIPIILKNGAKQAIRIKKNQLRKKLGKPLDIQL